MSAYLFAHFTSGKTGDKEAIWFSLSRDGLNWTDLGGEEPVLASKIGTRGARDPFIVYDERVKKYYIIATDLCTASGSWHDFAHHGSRSILVWESEDLINWSEEWLVEVGIENAGCVWAPEAVFCNEKDMWFVFWASCVKEDDETKHKQRIYGAFTKDFREFTPTFKYIDGKTALIDTSIVWDKGWYYRFSKDETNKVIVFEKSQDLVGDEWESIYSEIFSVFEGLEGPEAYYLDDQQKWCLIADQYRTNNGYTPFLCDNLDGGKFIQLHNDQFDMGKRKKRHGGILKISDELANKLIEHFGISEQNIKPWEFLLKAFDFIDFAFFKLYN